jgi:hypothetical protein
LKIYQIFYDENSMTRLDSSFIPFDNSNSNKFDWFEYSAIREIFRTNSFSPDEYVGIFSPKFYKKTGLIGTDVIESLENFDADVISFSPHFSHIALFKNIFIQGDNYHPGLLEVCRNLFDKIGLKINLDDLIMDQTRIIFSNYFIAKYSFWLEYFKFSERIYEIANGESELAAKLNSTTSYKNKTNIKMKVFVMERLISAVLTHLNANAAIGFAYTKSNYYHIYGENLRDFLVMDSLKSTYLKTKMKIYLRMYLEQRKKFIEKISNK